MYSHYSRFCYYSYICISFIFPFAAHTAFCLDLLDFADCAEQLSQSLFASVTRVHHNDSIDVALTLSDDGGAVKRCAGFILFGTAQ